LTLLVINRSAASINPHIIRPLPFDPLRKLGLLAFPHTPPQFAGYRREQPGRWIEYARTPRVEPQ